MKKSMGRDAITPMRTRWQDPLEFDGWWSKHLARSGVAKLHRAAEQLGQVAHEAGCRQTSDRVERWTQVVEGGRVAKGDGRALSFAAVVVSGVVLIEGSEPEDRQAWTRIDGACTSTEALQREGAAMALRVAGHLHFDRVMDWMRQWGDGGPCGRWRAAVVGLFTPYVLEPLTNEQVRRSWDVADEALRQAREQGEKTECLGLRKALGTGPSWLVERSPDVGFAQLERWADTDSILVKGVVASNLRKARLAKVFPDRVEQVGWRLTGYP